MIVIGSVYVLTLVVMFELGWGIAAGYLAMPGWLVVAFALLVLGVAIPPGAIGDGALWTVNMAALVLSDSLNVLAVLLVAGRVD